MRQRPRPIVAARTTRWTGRDDDRRDAPPRSRPRSRGIAGLDGNGRRGAGRRPLLGHRHVAPQPGSALAPHPRAARPAGDASGALARGRLPAGQVGGALVYVVCSLLDEEGAGQIAAFLGSHEGWSAEPPRIPTGVARGPGWRLTPAHDGTDGFFVARLVRTC